MNHSPGKWEVTTDPDNSQALAVKSDDGGYLVATVWPVSRIHDNAKLIAAAPELLAALESLLDATLGRVGPSSIDPDDDIESMRDKCLAAINKATL